MFERCGYFFFLRSRMFERCGVFFPVDRGCLRGVGYSFLRSPMFQRCSVWFFVRILRVIFTREFWREIFSRSWMLERCRVFFFIFIFCDRGCLRDVAWVRSLIFERDGSWMRMLRFGLPAKRFKGQIKDRLGSSRSTRPCFFSDSNEDYWARAKIDRLFLKEKCLYLKEKC